MRIFLSLKGEEKVLLDVLGLIFLGAMIKILNDQQKSARVDKLNRLFYSEGVEDEY